MKKPAGILILSAIGLVAITLVLSYGDRWWISRFHIGRFVYPVSAETQNELVISNGMRVALAYYGMDPDTWVPMAGVPALPRAETVEKPFEAFMMLSNRMKETFDLSVTITRSSPTSSIEYDIYRSK
jgi:hypothetical protein